MKKESKLKRFIMNILKFFKIIQEQEISKKEMCYNAINSGVCPKTCSSCAWNDKIYK